MIVPLPTTAGVVHYAYLHPTTRHQAYRVLALGPVMVKYDGAWNPSPRCLIESGGIFFPVTST